MVTGTGGIGRACARRLGSGRRLVLADFDAAALDRVAAELTDEGYDVTTQTVDVSDRASVDALAAVVRAAGELLTLVHTAGVSPSMAEPRRVLEVNMLGTDHVLAAHLDLARPGTVAVAIASSAAHIAAVFGMLTPEQDVLVAGAATDELLDLVGPVAESGSAYSIAKRVNLLRVERAALEWGRQGARVVSVSPGTISTPMGQLEISAPGIGKEILRQLESAPVPRIGTPQDIAAAVEWLASPAASFVTGCDLRVDGGQTAEVKARAASRRRSPSGP